MLSKPAARRRRELELDALVGKLLVKGVNLLLHNVFYNLVAKRTEDDHFVQAIPELRRKDVLNRVVDGFVGHTTTAETDHRLTYLSSARVRGHYDNDVSKIRLLAGVVGHGGVIHNLQQHVINVRMSLLDFIEQQHRVGSLADRVGELGTLVKAHVSRRRPKQTRNRVLLLVLAHVEAVHGDSESGGELPRQLGLTDTGRPNEEETGNRLVRVAKARA